MLLKKPFGLLIKYFKLIHLILTILIIYMLLKTNSIFSFLAEYIRSGTGAAGTHISSELFPVTIFLVIGAILMITFIVLGLMSFKKKPIRFYIYNIITYVVVTVIFLIAYSNIRTLEVGLVSIQTLKMIQDFLMLVMLLESISLILVSIRATGFNIKRFDFDKDLEDLKISEEDNEEFEVEVDLDTDKFRRKIRKRLRHAHYVYVENKFIINIIVLLAIAGICSIIYWNVGVYHNIYTQNQAFTTTEFMMNIKNSYVTNLDFHTDVISEDKKYVVVVYQARNIYEVKKKVMKPARFVLKIGGHTFHQIDTYQSQLYDLGNIYRNQYMSTKFQTYMMVYEIPKGYADDKMILRYYDTNRKVIDTEIKPIDDTKREVEGKYTLNQEFILTDLIMKDSKMKIVSYAIGDSFQSEYTYCATDTECYKGYEELRASTTDNYEKTLLKIEGYFQPNTQIHIKQALDLYILLRDFGTITYELDGNQKQLHMSFKQVKPNKADPKNIYYIEVPKELERATKIKISFIIRNKIYEIAVK